MFKGLVIAGALFVSQLAFAAAGPNYTNAKQIADFKMDIAKDGGGIIVTPVGDNWGGSTCNKATVEIKQNNFSDAELSRAVGILKAALANGLKVQFNGSTCDPSYPHFIAEYVHLKAAE